MTGDHPRGWGPLAWRLLAAFVLVALSAVVVLTGAALWGTERGLAASQSADRHQVAAQVSEAVGAAYSQTGGWSAVDLDDAAAIASGAQARLIVRDRDGSVVAGPGHGRGPMNGMSGMATGVRVDAPVVVGGTTVGTVQLVFPTAAGSAARDIAWAWIGLAAAVALAVALSASVFVSRRIAGPLRRLAAAATAISAGDRSARAHVRAPGELGELATAFDTMAEEVTRAEQNRRALTADVAHELRTPLAALQAGLEELRDGLVPADPHRLTSLHDQTLRLGRVVDDLAELAAAESAALSLRPAEVDLGRLAGDVLRAHAAELRAAGLHVRAELGDRVIVPADPDRLHQALGNLLGNTARYARPGDQVTVRVHPAGAGWAGIEVADTGPGIPADELPHIFDRWWRGRATTGTSGSGIGLAVVRELITAHGGTVTAESGPSGGATFTVRLPTR
ncbi:MAG TPA: HAMP domain-containing sensor histidine kinase [Actinophytocola sp.]|uniref:HAMP domain-containing sensor histidine kinase n=1 Tax=Actinophytocola sp. TaxID=1872138 RepID=UPI002DBE9C97|nr:HAMP domain-containing sensor histidine kinase [Actinophytocola sp.]HEU5474919.1 HAMP domain-containing sensor histidine kinase [Actinophytocola sp.]